MPVDYHKWDHIEVSDDEDDTHPNVDTASLFRWRHQARVERMAQASKEKEDFKSSYSEHQRKINEIKAKLTGVNLTDIDKERLTLELSDLEKQEFEFKRKEDELTKKEKLQPLNVDTIGHEGFSKSRINKIERPKPPEHVDEETKLEEMEKFLTQNRTLLKKFGMLRKWDDSKQFLLESPHLCCEETANHLVLQCLDYEMEEKHDLMEHVAHQTIIIQYLLELATQLKVSPRAPQLISSFFSKLKMADKMYHDAFEDELRQFKERIRRRAKEKLDEALKAAEEEERQKRLGPGGLDPAEVFESLPVEMQECFESQNVAKLQEVASKMDAEEFSRHLKRCIDSGLWIPDANKDQGPEDEQGQEVNISDVDSSRAEKPLPDSLETEIRQRKPTQNP